MDSIELIEHWGKILAGRVLIAGTKPLKAEIKERDKPAEMPDHYITSWYSVIYQN